MVKDRKSIIKYLSLHAVTVCHNKLNNISSQVNFSYNQHKRSLHIIINIIIINANIINILLIKILIILPLLLLLLLTFM